MTYLRASFFLFLTYCLDFVQEFDDDSDNSHSVLFWILSGFLEKFAILPHLVLLCVNLIPCYVNKIVRFGKPQKMTLMQWNCEVIIIIIIILLCRVNCVNLESTSYLTFSNGETVKVFVKFRAIFFLAGNLKIWNFLFVRLR